MKTQAASIACRWFGGAVKALAAVALVCATQARAEYKTWYDGKRTWTYFVADGKAALYNGGSPVIPETTAGAVTIPETMDGLPVTSIGDHAFAGCASMTGLTAHDGIETVGGGAFAGCTSLKSVRLPFQCVLEIAATEGAYGLIFSGCPADLALSGSVIDEHTTYHAERDVSTGRIWTYFTEEGHEGAILAGWPIAVDEDDEPLQCSACLPVPTGLLEIPETIGGIPVLAIGEAAFYNCTGITDLSIPEGVIVADSAFSGCTGLADANGFIVVDGVLHGYCGKKTDITIPDGVKGIGYAALMGNTTVKNVTIPGGVEYIGEMAFCECTSLRSVTILDGVKTIDEDVFRRCSSLRSVTIPNSVTCIKSRAFEDCAEWLYDTTIPGVKIVDGWVVDSDEDISGALVLSGVRGIADRVFYQRTGLTSVTIADGVKYIGYEAFGECTGILSLSISGSVESIGEVAFYFCRNLASVSIANGVKSIGERAFQECAITDITLPDSVTSLGESVFNYCENLKTASLPGHLRGKISEADVFENCPADLVVTYREAVADSHTLKFDSNGGVFSGANFGSMNGKSGVAQVSVSCGKGSYGSGMRATKSGYTFQGWWTAATGGSMQYDANGKFVPGSTCWTSDGKWKHHGNAILYARWAAVTTDSHTLKFDTNGGVFSGANFGSMNGKSGVAQVSVSCGKGSYSSGMRATKSGSVFQGWWTAVSGGSQQYDANGKFIGGSTCWDASGKWKHHGNAMLYARWGTSADSHTVKFDTNGGVFSGANFGSMNGKSGVAQISVSCGKGSYNSGMRATKTGATFNGWWTAVSGGSMQYDANGKFVPNSTCWDANGKWKHHGNATLYARW